MSQKPRSFQSKRTGGGQKFSGGGKPGGGGRGRGFSKGSERDGEKRSDSRAPRPTGDRPPRRDGEGFKSDRPRKSFGDRDSRPPRADGDRPPRRDFGDKPYKKRSFEGDSRPPRRDGEGFKSDRPRKSFGDRDSRPPRADGDRPPRRDFGDKPYKKRSFEGDSRPPRRDGEGFKSDRPRKSFGDRDSRPPRRDGGFKSDRPRKSFGDKPSYDKKRSFGDKPAFRKEQRFDDRPARTFDDAAPRDDIRQKLKSERPSYGAPSAAYLYGVHAVSQALLNPDRRNKRLLCTEKGFESVQEAWEDAEAEGRTLPVKTLVEKEDIDRLLPRDAVHQDLLLDTLPLEETYLADITLHAPEGSTIVVLDQVTDPHNIGAIMRSAAAFGAIAVVVQTLHAPDITGVLAKTASGAVEHVPLVREVNLSRALENLKKAGFFCIGLAEEGKSTLASMKLAGGKTALVLGAEGDGLRRLVAENCDELAKLPTQGAIGSLNVSNAAAVALYEIVRAKK